MINKVILIGRIVKDVELRKTPNGISTVSFTLAVNRTYKKDGEQEADFINCVAWRNSADFMANYVNKGALLGVEGRIQVRNYKDQSDRTVYVTEVVCDSVQLLESKKDASKETPKQNDELVATVDVTSDELPF